MTTRNITTTTRRIVLALGVATAAVIAIPSTQEAAHAASIGAYTAPLAAPKAKAKAPMTHWGCRSQAPQGWSGYGHTPQGWSGHGRTPQGWSGHGHTPQGFKYGTPPVSFRVDVKPQGWSF